MTAIKTLGFVFCCAALTGGAKAQDRQHAGADKLGTVHYQTSCTPAVAPSFDHAIALLHSFEFGPAIRGFSEVLAADSTCSRIGGGTLPAPR